MSISPHMLSAASFAALAGLALAFLAAGTVRVGGHGDNRKLRRRLTNEQVAVTSGRDVILDALVKIGEKIAAPFMSDQSEAKQRLRRELVAAGIYSSQAVKYVVAARIVLLGGGALLGLVLAGTTGNPATLGLAGGGLAGYLFPRFWLKARVRKNHQQLSRGLPDALDLMVVCVEAGLTVDAAMQRVGDELALVHPSLARELTICHMETRIGVSRQKAMQNLGSRAGFAPLQAVTAMLIQAERFGTSIGNALRIQAEALRVRRQHHAEEAASKASVKLSFPLVLFIFPATFIVLAGPMVINFMTSDWFN